jgi:hypothetical protein
MVLCVQGCLLRCAQPLNVGGKRSYEDEKYFRKILQSSTPHAKRGTIYDLRAATEAKVLPYNGYNKIEVNGKGAEKSGSNYVIICCSTKHSDIVSVY